MMKLKLVSGSCRLPLIIVSIISFLIITIAYIRTEVLIQERYARVAKEIHQQTQTLINEKKEAILLVALSLGEDSNIKKALIFDDSKQLQLNKFSQKLELHTPIKNLMFQIIKKNGDSLYRSWTRKNGDNLLKARLDVAEMLLQPEIKTAISTGKFDLTFKAMVPVYDDDEFIGIFEVIAKFNSIANKLEKQGIDSVFLVDKSYKKQIIKPFTEKFLQDFYVANVNVKQNYLDLMQQNRPEHYINSNSNFLIDKENNLLAVYFALPDIQNMPMGHFILFKSLDNIDISDIYSTRNQQFIYIALLAVLLFVIIQYMSSMHLTQKIKEINHQLEEKVSAKNKELINQGHFLQTVLDGLSDSVMVIDKDFNVSMMNKVAKSILKEKQDSGDMPKCYNISRQLDFPCLSTKHKCPHSEVFTSGKTSKIVQDHITSDGKAQFLEITATPLFDEEGEVEAIIELAHDITTHLMIHEQLQQQKNRLDHQAHHDALTGLPNRVLLTDRLHQAIKQAKREHYKVAVLVIDLDRFKEINDSLGHSVGDEVLVEIARRLRSGIRSVDTVARLGGDEFTIILANIERTSAVMEVGQKLIEILGEKIMYGEHELYITASIGISLYPDDGDNTEILLRNSDSAMYQAKEVGRNNYQFYTQEMTEQAFERILMEKNLRRAIEEDEFMVFYQSQYNSRSDQFIGMEALLRWQHPEMGLVSPAKFIPIAEETGLIVEIGWLVMEKVIQQMMLWKTEELHYGQLSINLSVKQIQQKDFINKILEGLEKYQYHPQEIQFEVTESYIMTDPEVAIKTLRQLKDLTFTISIDDFGTGYSSLSYLKRLPIDELKIDQSFVRDVPGDEEDEAIVRSVISLAKSMNLKVIAEGVETAEQQAFLLTENCENIQGYLLQRPVDARAMTEILRSRKTPG